MASELLRENLQRIGIEFNGSNVVLYHLTTAENLAQIVEHGEIRPTNSIETNLKRVVWTNPGETGNDDRIHLARMDSVEKIASHMRFRLENGGGLYIIRLDIPTDSPNLVPDQDTKAANWRESLLHNFGTCAYQGKLQINSSSIVGRYSIQPGDEEYIEIYKKTKQLEDAIDRITNVERRILNDVGIVLEDIPLLGE